MKQILLPLLFLMFTAQWISAQIVSTYTDGTPDDAIAIDSNGDVYASNFIGDTIFKFDSNGNATAFITGLDTPNGIAFDSQDNLYVCDWNANLISRYDSSGTLDSSITIPGRPSGMIKAFDNDDMIYTRYSGNTINRITPSGTITEISSAPELNGPVGLAYNEVGDLFVGNYNNREVYRVLPNGDLAYIATVGNGSNLGFIAFAQGFLWGTNLGEHTLYAIDPNGTDLVYHFAGSTPGGNDGPIEDATFSQPNGILFDATGDTMYVTDFGTKNLRIISDVMLSVPDSELKTDVRIYPNPATDEVRIKASNQLMTIQVYDIGGKLVYQNTAGTTVHVMNVHSWSEGLYNIKLTTEDGVQSKKLIVKH